jgi:dTDP-4-amino-4,6-dideoxygalactose transaminase
MKRSLNDLALLGGSPTFTDMLHVGRPNIGDRSRFLARVNDMLDRKWLSNNGPYVQEFERKLCELLEVKNCIAVCNATVALEIAIKALEMKGEVLVPSFTFIATAHALQWQEVKPVFCDIDPKTHNLNPRLIERMITPQTTGILGVHVWGRPCAIEELTEISQRHGLKLLFDAAHAFGCSYSGRMIGNFGEAEVFSFHATKFFNTFEGGAIVTNNDELAQKMRWMTNFGFAGYDRVVYLGTNGKMTEIAAAMGLTSLESLDEFVSTNFHNYCQYKLALADIPGIQLVNYDERERNNYQYIILEIDETVTHLNRDQLVRVLHAENILARRYFYPGCHQMEPYRSYSPEAGLLLPETEKLASRALSLPNGTAVGEEEIHKICQIIRFGIANGQELSRRMAQETK